LCLRAPLKKNIAEDDVIRACLQEAGFDPALADSGLLSGAETYSANLEEVAVAKGAFGAPFLSRTRMSGSGARTV
jgi:2-hydroxychromene-2-carboxylate isomerase